MPKKITWIGRNGVVLTADEDDLENAKANGVRFSTKEEREKEKEIGYNEAQKGDKDGRTKARTTKTPERRS